jgi:hypothetical protein
VVERDAIPPCESGVRPSLSARGWAAGWKQGRAFFACRLQLLGEAVCCILLPMRQHILSSKLAYQSLNMSSIILLCTAIFED